MFVIMHLAISASLWTGHSKENKLDISIEISMYPLAEAEYKKHIWGFVEQLKQVSELRVVTNGMSTQVFGEYDLATSTVMSAIKQVHMQTQATVFICKIIGSDRSHLLVE